MFLKLYAKFCSLESKYNSKNYKYCLLENYLCFAIVLLRFDIQISTTYPKNIRAFCKKTATPGQLGSLSENINTIFNMCIIKNDKIMFHRECISTKLIHVLLTIAKGNKHWSEQSIVMTKF